MQLRTAMLYVKDMERVRRFYREALRAAPCEQSSSDDWVVFESGAARFALHRIPDEIARKIEIACPAVPREQGSMKLVFEVEDVELECTRLESLGAQVLRRPWQRLDEACDMADPEGNVFQLCVPADRRSAFGEAIHAK